MPTLLVTGNVQRAFPAIFDVLNEHLPAFHITTDQPESGNCALGKEENPDSILVYGDSENTDGFDRVHQLKSDETTQRIPIIMLIPMTDTKARIRALKSNIDAVCSPGVDEELVLQIRAVMRRKKNEYIIRKEKEQLEVLLRKAQKAEAIGTLTGGIAHDFNNILTIIIGYTEITQRKLANDPKISGNLLEVAKAGYRARDLVKQLLSFSRQSEQEKKPFQISLVVKEALKMLKASLPSTIEIQQNVQTESGKILADPVQIHQLLMNLCMNSAHALENGGVLSVGLNDVDINPENAEKYPGMKFGAYLELSVCHIGKGNPQSSAQKTPDFDLPEENVKEMNRIEPMVMQSIVKNHNGTLCVLTDPEKGTVQQVYFPRLVKNEAEKNNSPSPLLTGKGHLLIIDDEQVLLNWAKDMLEDLGYDVTACTNSMEALKVFSEHPNKFDLVVTDLTMPHLTGTELAKGILTIRPDMPIILCSGYSEAVTKEKAQAIGIQEIITKPMIPEELTNKIHHILNKTHHNEKDPCPIS